VVEVRFSIESAIAPERVLAAATDFSERRPGLWSGIDPTRYRVHALGDNWADVTEGGRELGGIWSRERYNWSQQGKVIAEVQESNVFGAGSRWELRVQAAERGGSQIEWITERHPKGIKGRILVLMLAVGGRKYLTEYLLQTLKGLEKAASEHGTTG
jgi:hypothetical protein